MAVPTLVMYLDAHGSASYLDQDENWRQFVLDHRVNIKEQSTPWTLTPGMYNQCAYDLRRWMREININESIYWIVMIINGLDSDMDFVEGTLPNQIWVPSETVIGDLYNSYLTSTSSTVAMAVSS